MKVQSARVRLSNIQINDSPAFSFVRSFVEYLAWKKKEKPGSFYLSPNVLDILQYYKEEEGKKTSNALTFSLP